MRLTLDPRHVERVFLIIIILTLASFAYHFTISDLEEVQSRYTSRRVTLVKLLAREVVNLLQSRQDVTSRLLNLLAEETVAYALVQLPGSEILAKAETEQVAVGTLQDIEATALQAPHLHMQNFFDSSGAIPLTEFSIPLAIEGSKKVVLRIGFFRAQEVAQLRQVRFRNLLLISTLLLGLFFYWLVRRRQSADFQTSLMSGVALLILFLFLGSRLLIQQWYDRNWHQNFVRQGMGIAKIVSVAAGEFLKTGESTALKSIHGLLETDDAFTFLAVAKDEQYLYHSDASLQGQFFQPDANFTKSLNTTYPVVFQLSDPEHFEVLVPLLSHQQRLGTMRLGLRNITGHGPLALLRNRLVLVFLVALVILLFLVHLLARRIAKEVSWFIKAMEQVTAGDLRQQIFIERNDEFGQMAHSFNFMLMSLKERDFLGRGLQHYVSKSIVDQTLKAVTSPKESGEKVFVATLTVYLSGLSEVIQRLNGPEVFSHIREIHALVKKVCPPSSHCHVQVLMDGILVLFSHPSRHEVLLRAFSAAPALGQALEKKRDLPFSPRLTLHSLEMVFGSVDEQEELPAFLGEAQVHFRAFAQVQDVSEVIASEETSYLLRDVAEFDELEICTPDQGRVRGFVFKGFKLPEDLVILYPTSSPWNKVLILRILKGHAAPEQGDLLLKWFDDPDANVRYQIMDVLERLQPKGVVEFVVNVLEKETDQRVLARAISALGKVGNESHLPILAERLRTGDRRVKANAVEALEAIGGKKVYEFLNLLVDEQDNRVKANILIALGKYGDLKVFELLSRMIRDEDHSMRASAAFALGRLGMAQGVEPLVSALADKDPGVRRQVVASLSSLKADLEIEI